MNPQYTCLSSPTYYYNNYSVTSLRPSDIFEIMKWRNAQLDVLRQQAKLTKSEQQDYFDRIIKPSYDQSQPDLVLLSILKDDKLIGYGGFVHINWQAQRAEISFLTPSERANDPAIFDEDFSSFLEIVKEIALKDLSINRLCTETFDIRPNVLKILENAGFVREGVMRDHNCIQGKYCHSVIHGFLSESNTKKAPLMRKEATQNILVTSISQKIPLLKLLHQVIIKCFPQSMLYGGDADPSCLGRHFVDVFWNMPEDNDITVDDIIKYCSNNNISTIIPTRDGELQFYADHVDQFLNNSIHVMISDREAIQICHDKMLFSSFLLQQNAANIIPSSDTLKADFGETLVIKERFGAGSSSIRLNLSPKEAEKYAKALISPIFQPHICGHEFSIDLYISVLTRNPLGCIVRSRDRVIHGESRETTVVDNPVIQKICIDAAKVLGLMGHVMFQIIIDEDNQPHIIECNCRIGGASTLSMHAGLHSLQWFLMESRGQSIPIAPLVTGIKGLRLRRIPQDILDYSLIKDGGL